MLDTKSYRLIQIDGERKLASNFDISKQLKYNLFIMVRQLKIEIQVVEYLMFSIAIKDKELCEIEELMSI